MPREDIGAVITVHDPQARDRLIDLALTALPTVTETVTVEV
jgi:hypothetical protein